MTHTTNRSATRLLGAVCLMAAVFATAHGQDSGRQELPLRERVRRGGLVDWSHDLAASADEARRTERAMLLYFTHDT